MKKLTPRQMLEYTTRMLDQMNAVKGKAVFVGLPTEKVGGKVYGNGMSIFQVGAVHEFGYGPIPERSFLRVPFNTKRKDINSSIAKQFELMTSKGLSIDVALGRIGIICENISRGAFTSLGYGSWEPSSPETNRRKGSSQTLVDTALLKGAITSVARDVA